MKKKRGGARRKNLKEDFLKTSQSKKGEERKEEIKNILPGNKERRRANEEISYLLLQFKGRYSILDCLGLIKRRYSPYVLEVALERVERKKERNELSMEEVVEFERFKQSLS